MSENDVKPKHKKCPKGYHIDKKKGECIQNDPNKTKRCRKGQKCEPDIIPVVEQPTKKYTRCPKGTRKNRKTRECEKIDPKNDPSVSKTPKLDPDNEPPIELDSVSESESKSESKSEFIKEIGSIDK